MKSQIIHVFVEDADGQEVVVEGRYVPAERGSRGRFGEQLEPDYGEQIDVISAQYGNGSPAELCSTMLCDAIIKIRKEAEPCDPPDDW
jgi:hypothetical protein